MRSLRDLGTQGVSVRFHAAEKDIPESGQFTKERFNGLTVPNGWGGFTIMVEDEKHVSHGGRQEKTLCRETPLFLFLF